MPTRANETVLQLRAQLRDVAPAVWRRLLVPGSIRMDKFHMVLQAAMGWTNSHLHNFSVVSSPTVLTLSMTGKTDWPNR